MAVTIRPGWSAANPPRRRGSTDVSVSVRFPRATHQLLGEILAAHEKCGRKIMKNSYIIQAVSEKMSREMEKAERECGQAASIRRKASSR